MKKAIVAFALFLLTASAAFSQTQSIAFTNSTGGNSSTIAASASFTLTAHQTVSGYNSNVESYSLQLPTALAPYITITGATYFTFTLANQADYPKVFTSTTGASSGFVTEQGSGNGLSGDLGGTSSSSSGFAPGTYQVTNLNFTLNGAPSGTYVIASTTVNPKVSIVSDSNFATHNLAQSTFTLTVVPEPSSWAMLLAGGAIALGISYRLRRRVA